MRVCIEVHAFQLLNSSEAGISITPVKVSGLLSVKAPFIGLNTHYTVPSVLAINAAVNAVTVRIGTYGSISATTLAGVLTVNAPTVVGKATVSPTVRYLTATINAVLVKRGQIYTQPAALAVTSTAVGPTVTLGGATTVSPSVLSATTTAQTATVDIITTNAMVSPSVLQLSGTLKSVSIYPMINATIVALTGAFQTPTYKLGIGISPSVFASTATVVAPTINLGTADTVTPTVLALTCTAQQPTAINCGTKFIATVLAVTGQARQPENVGLGTGTIIEPTVRALTTTVQSPTLIAKVNHTASVLSVTATVYTPTFRISYAAQPTAFNGYFSVSNTDQLENLLIYSNDFTNSIWVPEITSVSSTTQGPDGNATGGRRIEEQFYPFNAGHYISQIMCPMKYGIRYSISFHLKAGERTFARIQACGGCYAYFDLIGGITGYTNLGQLAESWANPQSSIEYVDYSYWKCTLTVTSTDSFDSGIVLVGPAIGNGSGGDSDWRYETGTNFYGLYVAWAQVRSTAYTLPVYVPTTSSKVISGYVGGKAVSLPTVLASTSTVYAPTSVIGKATYTQAVPLTLTGAFQTPTYKLGIGISPSVFASTATVVAPANVLSVFVAQTKNLTSTVYAPTSVIGKVRLSPSTLVITTTVLAAAARGKQHIIISTPLALTLTHPVGAVVYSGEPNEVLNFYGFESGAADEGSWSGANYSVTNSYRYDSAYSVRINDTIGYFNALKIDNSTTEETGFNAAGEFIITVRLYIVASGGNEIVISKAYDTNGALIAQLKLGTDRKVKLVDFNGSTVITSTNAIALNTWTKVESKFDQSNTALCEIKINGASNGTGIGDFQFISAQIWNVNLGIVDGTATGWDIYLDDVILSRGNYPSDSVVRIATPNGYGAHHDWTGSYIDVDEVPISAVDYAVGSGTNKLETYNLTNCSTGGIATPILAVKALYKAAGSGGSCLPKAIVRSGGIDYISSSSAFIGAATSVYQFYKLLPDNSGSWTTDAIDSLEIGMKQESGITTILQGCHLMVLSNASHGMVVNTTVMTLTGGKYSPTITIGTSIANSVSVLPLTIAVYSPTITGRVRYTQSTPLGLTVTALNPSFIASTLPLTAALLSPTIGTRITVISTAHSLTIAAQPPTSIGTKTLFNATVIALTATVQAPTAVRAGRIVNFVGFETGDTSETFFSGVTTGCISTTQTKGGIYSFRVNKTGTDTVFCSLRTPPADGDEDNFNTHDLPSDIGCSGFHFYIASATNATMTIWRFFDAIGNTIASIKLNSSNQLVLANFVGTTIYTSAALSTGAWHWIEIKIQVNNSGVYAFKIDGITVASGTEDFYSSNGQGGTIWIGDSASGYTCDLYFDNLYLATDQFFGEMVVHRLAPISAGGTYGWTGSYIDVDEIIPSSADYIRATTGSGGTPLSESFAFDNPTSKPLLNCKMVKQVAWIFNADNNNSHIKFVRENILTDGYYYTSSYLNTPNSGYVRRTITYSIPLNQVNNWCYGIENTGSTSVNVSAMCLMVIGENSTRIEPTTMALTITRYQPTIPTYKATTLALTATVFGVGSGEEVAFESTYWSNMSEWAGYIHTYLGNLNDSTVEGKDAGLAAVYYDGELCRYRLADHFNDTVTYYAMANEASVWYLDYHVLGMSTQGQVSGYRNFPEGIVERFIRQNDSDCTTAINAMEINALYLNTGDLSDDTFPADPLTRECAYALNFFIELERFGTTLDSTQLTRRGVVKDWCLGHIDYWCDAPMHEPYYRPFMGALTAMALIKYHENVSADSGIVTALEKLANFTWDNCWLSASKSFMYTDRETDSGGTESAPDLNMLVAPLFGWLYKKTLNSNWKTKGDQIFEGGISVYDQYGYYVSGAYLGTKSSSNPSGKQYNQQLYWGPKYLEWVAGTGGITITTENNPPAGAINFNATVKSLTSTVYTPSVTNPPAGVFTTTQTGNWNSASTWTQGSVPDDGDTVTISHVVTVTASAVIGHSPGASDTTKAVSISSGGSLILKDGVTFTCRGDFSCSASNTVRSLDMEAGSTFEFDARYAASPSTARYRLILTSQYPGTQPSFRVVGTTSKHCIFRSNSGGCYAVFVGSGTNNYGLISAEYCDFLRLGDASNGMASSIISSDGSDSYANLFSVKNCTFDYCSRWDFNFAHIGAYAKMTIQNNIWSNSTHTTNIYNYASYNAKAGAGVRLIDGNVFDKYCEIKAPRDTTVTKNYFHEGLVNTSTDATTGMTFEENFVRMTDAYGGATLNTGNIKNNYFFYDDNDATNVHLISMGNYTALTTQTCEGNIFESSNSDGTGDCIMINATGATMALTIKNNIFLPNATGENTGTPFSALGSSYINMSFNHNTYFIGTQGVRIGETYAGYAGMLTAFKSNIAWDTSSRGYKLNGTSSVQNYATSSSINYNCGYNINAGSNLKGYNSLSFSSGSPGANDIDINPSFTDSTRDLISWDLASGGSGTLTAALTRLRGKTTSITNLLTYVKAGFVVGEATLINAGHDSITIGAIS